MLYVLDSPALAAALESADDPEAVGVTDELARLDREVDELAADYADGKVNRRAYFAATAALEDRRGKLQDQLGRMRSHEVLTGGAVVNEDDWNTLTLDRKRAVIAALIERITVGPARRGVNTFDPDRVAVTWRA